jgi:hypothetical protein
MNGYLYVHRKGCWVLQVLDEVAKTSAQQRPFQSNTHRSRTALSVIGIGLALVRKSWISFSSYDWRAALTKLRKCADWTQV